MSFVSKAIKKFMEDIKNKPLDIVLADVISYIFNPYDFGILLLIIGLFKDGNVLYGVVALLSLALLPLLWHLKGVRRGHFDWNINEYRKRTSILALSGIGGLLGFWVLYEAGAYYVSIATLSYALTSIVAAACSRTVKVSIHVATALTSSIILGWAFGTQIGALAIALSVAIAWSRLKLKAHTLPEVLEGYAVAGIGTTSAFLLVVVAL